MSAFDNVNQNVFGFTALVVSLVALVTTIAQVLQQYFSSAEGYRRCAASVMGDWSKGTHRKLVAREFRVEVVFETPVIFVAPPTNKYGPIAGREIHYIDGTDESCTNTRVPIPDPPKKASQKPRSRTNTIGRGVGSWATSIALGIGSRTQTADQEAGAQVYVADQKAATRVHTADDERASWLTLLTTLQRAEKDSRLWDTTMRNTADGLPRPTKNIRTPEYQITVGLQIKTRSWDFIPPSITKPYATTAICHLVEMMAMLGLYWKEFDQTTWNLRAEGNGFILTSTTVHGLGVMVVFAVTGKSHFKKERVIPCNEVKELAFGTVPNIFEDNEYLKKEREAQNFQLVFGNIDEIRSTLESLGCSAGTSDRYEKDHKHIFSIAFEIIGMLGKPVRIRGSAFRMVPNPTSDSWLRESGRRVSWKITRFMEVFQKQVANIIETEGFREGHLVHAISQKWTTISSLGCEDENNLSLEVREAIHDALEDMTKYLLSLKQSIVLGVIASHLSKVLEFLEDQHSYLNNIGVANKEEDLLEFYFFEIRTSVIESSEATGKPLSNGEKEQRHTIWISLIFRMLCWLLLHDFHISDTRVVPTSMKGSRMPIYIG